MIYGTSTMRPEKAALLAHAREGRIVAVNGSIAGNNQ